MTSNNPAELLRKRFGRAGAKHQETEVAIASPFRGIFDEDPSKVNPFYGEITARLQKHPEGKKPWGVRLILIAFLLTLVTQGIIAGIAYFTILAPSLTAGYDQDEVIQQVSSPAIIIASSLAMYAVWFSVLWFIAQKRDVGGNWRDHFRLRFQWRDIPIGLGIAIGMILTLQLVSWVLQTVFGLDLTGSDNGSAFGPGNGVMGILIAIFIATLAGPISEEVFFRGIILRGLQNSASRSPIQALRKIAGPLAVVLSSVAFGFMHFQGTETFGQWFVIIVTGSLGLVFGILTYKLNRIGPAVAGHVFYNGGTILLAYLTVS